MVASKGTYMMNYDIPRLEQYYQVPVNVPKVCTELVYITWGFNPRFYQVIIMFSGYIIKVPEKNHYTLVSQNILIFLQKL
jgi:hypothetical protein